MGRFYRSLEFALYILSESTTESPIDTLFADDPMHPIFVENANERIVFRG